MNIITKALQIVRFTAMRFVGAMSGWTMFLLGRTRFNYAREVGDGRGNSIVVACIAWVCRTFPEAPIRVKRLEADGSGTVLPDHPLVLLLARPNSYYSGELLWKATLLDLQVTGNAYWLKVRNGSGRPIELWWVPQHLIEPRWPDDGSVYISHYEYTPLHMPINVAISDVVHFRDGLDPTNTRKGLSPLASLTREIFTDDEAANYSASLLRNLGVPGVVISPDNEMGTMMPEDAKAIKADFASKFGGDNRGEPMVISAKAKVTPLSFNPQQMDLRTLRRLPEERISAVLGVPAIVAGLGAGLDRSTFANMSEAREMAYESNIIPTQHLLAGELKAQLLPDFGDATRLQVEFDVRKVRVLQEDQMRIWTRTDMAVRGGWLMVSRAKELVGEIPEETDNVYLRSMSVIEVRPGALEGPEEILPTPPKGRRVVEKGVEVYGSKAHQRVWARFIRRVAAWEKMLTRPVQALFRDQQEAVLARLRGEKILKQEDPFDLDAWEKLFRDAVRPVIRTIVGEVGQAALEDVGLSLVFDVFDPHTVAFLNGRAQRFAERISKTTWQELKDSLSEGMVAGESIEELAGRVQDVMGDRIASTPTVIARTEVIGAANGGTLEAWKQSDVVQGKMWISALDDRTRESHISAHGQIVGLDEDFHVGDGDGPHPGGIGLPEEDIQCFAPGTLVEGLFLAGSKIRYSGPIWELETRRGYRLSVTSNHPILTDQGWLPAHKVREGMCLYSRSENVKSGVLNDKDNENGPLPIEDVFEALAANGTERRAMVKPLDFHGDAAFTDGKVHIVRANRILPRDGEAIGRGKYASKSKFIPALAPGFIPKEAQGAPGLGFWGINPPATSLPGGGKLAFDSLGIGAHSDPLYQLCVGPASDWNVPVTEEAQQGATSVAAFVGKLFEASSGLITADQVVSVRERQGSHFVYDLQSSTGWILAQNIVSANCRCAMNSVLSEG